MSEELLKLADDWLAPRMVPSTPYLLIRDLAARVRELEAERDRYHDALIARHGGEPIALLSELDEARAERDAFLALLRETLQWGAYGTGSTLADRIAAAIAAKGEKVTR